MAHVINCHNERIMERVTKHVGIAVANVPLRRDIVTERADPADPFSPIVRQYEREDKLGVVYLHFDKSSRFSRWLRVNNYGGDFRAARGLWVPMSNIGVAQEVSNWLHRQLAGASVAQAILRGHDIECDIWANII